MCSGWSDGTVLLWSYALNATGSDSMGTFLPATSVREAKTIKGHNDAICGLLFHDAGGMLLTSSIDGRTKVWTASGTHLGRVVRTFCVAVSPLTHMVVLPLQLLLATCTGEEPVVYCHATFSWQ